MQHLLKIDSGKASLQRLFSLVAILSIVAGLIAPMHASAAQLTARKLTLGSSAGNTSTTWTLQFTAPASTAIKGIGIQVCDSASGTCTTPGSWANTGATFGSLTYNGSSQSGWTIDNTTSGYLRMKNNSSAASVTSPVVATFNTVTNPNTTNSTFYGRVVTYTGNDFTTPLDSGVVAASTSQQINLTGTMDESLVFCVGTSITGQNCGTISGSSVNFGSFDSTTAKTGTSVMAASTNGLSGYSITMNGSTLTCATCSGTPTIAALSSQTASSPGSAQFGANLKSNSSPSVGAEVSGGGSGTATANYGTTNQFRFVTGDSVASASAATNANAYTVSYLANVPGNQAAGTYTATMTYIATATF